MTIKFKTSDVLPKVNQLAGLVGSKNIIKIFESLLFQVNGNNITITASDSETWFSLNAPLSEIASGETTSFCIDAAKFKTALSTLESNELVELELDDARHIANFKYTNGHFELPFNDGSDFPNTETQNKDELFSINIACGHLLSGIDATLFATDTDELRPQMSGVHIDFVSDNNKTKMVYAATDTRKLVRFKEDVEFGEELVGKGFTLPKKAAHVISQYLLKVTDLDNTMKLRFNETQLVELENTEMKLSTRVVAGRYPNYNAVIPIYERNFAFVKRDAFVSALRRVMPFGNQKTQMVVLSFKQNQIVVSADDMDYNTSAKEMFPCEYNGEEINIGFPANAMIEVVKNVSCEDVCIKLFDATRPAVVEPKLQTENFEYISIQMPMVIN